MASRWRRGFVGENNGQFRSVETTLGDGCDDKVPDWDEIR
jgi:hypothetical protein